LPTGIKGFGADKVVPAPTAEQFDPPISVDVVPEKFTPVYSEAAVAFMEESSPVEETILELNTST
jgi:hypothetical protein